MGNSIEILKSKLFEREDFLTFYERIELLEETENMFNEYSYAEKYGYTLQHILSNVSICIDDNERLFGRVKEIIPNQAQYQHADNMSERWWGNGDLEKRRDSVHFYYSHGWLKRRAPWFHSMGHLGLQWEEILELGLQGYINKAEGLLAEKNGHQADFLRGAVICYRAIQEYISRYEQTLSKAATEVNDPQRAVELEHASHICKQIVSGAPQSFEQAVQLIWLISLVCSKVCGCGVLNFGRMDQYLLALYEQDTAQGRISSERALEIIKEFYIKNNEIMVNVDHMSVETDEVDKQLEVTFDDPNYIILGGLSARGKSGVNPLSFLFVQAANELRLKNPFIIVRYHKGICERFLHLVCDGIIHNATLVLYNDDTMLPALTRYGIRDEDVYDYGFYGCNDPSFAGKEGGLRQLWFNLAIPMELALNNGQMYKGGPSQGNFPLEDRMTGLMSGLYAGLPGKALESITTLDELFDQFQSQVEFLLGNYYRQLCQDVNNEVALSPGRLRIEDCFLHGTLENATTWTGCSSLYHKIITQGVGLATVVDSFAALAHYVFDLKQFTLAEYVEILKNDFQGHQDLLDELANSPLKYGNDNPQVDQYAKRIVDIFTDACQATNQADGTHTDGTHTDGTHTDGTHTVGVYKLFPTLSSDRSFTDSGLLMGASANGRLSNQPLSENQSPCTGADNSGVTSLLNSVASIPFNKITGGPLNVKLHPTMVKGVKGLEMFKILIKTYMAKGGMQVQTNILNREDLIQAQKTPEKYRDLCIRITGYSAYFTKMGKLAQDEIIARTEHG